MTARSLFPSIGYLDEMAVLLDTLPRQPIYGAVTSILVAHEYDRAVFVVSSADTPMIAIHFADELARRTQVPGRAALKVVPLWDSTQGTNVPTVMGQSMIEQNQLRALLHPGDVVIVLNMSGQWEKLMADIQTASKYNTIIIGITTQASDEFMELTDHCIVLPDARAPLVEDVQRFLSYALADEVHAGLMSK